ncbi:MAG: bifunctional nuclease family protein [Chloroflexi bacterium]|nr:bifunctional nuclease family protein [Chloroflexota bacterium]
MVEVTIDSIRVSLMSQHRVVILKDVDSNRYLPIWIGPCEADAITVSLQEVEVARPLTHDLLKNVLDQMGGSVVEVQVHDLRDDVFFARLIVRVNSKLMEIDSRPSDALALAVRANVTVYVAEKVMELASVVPDEELETEPSDVSDERLSVFKDFVDSLDLDVLGASDEEPDNDD